MADESAPEKSPIHIHLTPDKKSPPQIQVPLTPAAEESAPEKSLIEIRLTPESSSEEEKDEREKAISNPECNVLPSLTENVEKLEIRLTPESKEEKSQITSESSPEEEKEERHKAISNSECSVIPSFTENEENEIRFVLSEEEEEQKYVIDAVCDKWENELLLAIAQEEEEEEEEPEKTQKSVHLYTESENWEKVYSYEEKRLNSLLHGEEWEKKNLLWEIENGLVPLADYWGNVNSYEEKKRKAHHDTERYDKWEKDNHLVEEWENVGPLPVVFEDWEDVYSYDEKRPKYLVDGEGYDKWEKDNRLWETQNHLIPIVEERDKAAPLPVGFEDWENVYSYEEKRLKYLVDGGEGYGKWETKKGLWEIENYLVPSMEFWEREYTYEQKNIFDVVSEKWEEELCLALEEELQSLKRLYKDKKRKSAPFDVGFANWENVYSYEEKRVKALVDGEGYGKWEKENWLWEIENGLIPIAEEWEKEYLLEEERLKRLKKRENLATLGRCLDGSYLTPYCKCDKEYYRFNTALDEHPPEFIPIWLAYCRQFRQSHCFDIDDYMEGRVGPLAPSKDFDGKAEIMMELANCAIQEYNEKECNVFKYKVLKIEKVNYSVAMYYTFWMTVKVLNLTLGTPIETFQIHAGFSDVNDDKEIDCCRPKEEAIIGLPSCEFCFGLLPERRVTEGKEP